jgi:hypothetical protein
MYRQAISSRFERFALPVGVALGVILGVMIVVVLSLHKAPM